MESAGSEEEQRIKETVLEILKSSNMDETTEFKIRKTASDKLGLDLNTRSRKQIVRGVVEGYLNDQQPQEEREEEEEEEEEEEDEDNNRKRKGGAKEYDDDGDLIICKLSDKRRVTIQDFKGRTLVSLREYYKRDGKELPTAKVAEPEIINALG